MGAAIMLITVLLIVVSLSTHASTNEGEPVLGFRTDGDRLIFRVATGGCTRAEDFDIRAQPMVAVPGAIELRLIRVTPDYCKGFFPEGVEIAFERMRVGVPADAQVLLANPLRCPAYP